MRWTLVFEVVERLSDLANYPAPFEAQRVHVRPEWIDHNGHMNVAYYLMAFDESIGELFDAIGLTRASRRENQIMTFVGDFHIQYLRELVADDPIQITHQLVGYDQKRIHLCLAMNHADQGYVAALAEVISLHIDANTRRVSPMGRTLYREVSALAAAHAHLPAPSNQSRVISIAPKTA
jgi:acyl-CoA thioester hydrolase